MDAIFNFEALGEAMRPMRDKSFRLSREERDHIAGHALDSINKFAHDLWSCTTSTVVAGEETASDCARKIAALSNLLGDIGWEREQPNCDHLWFTGLGQLFPVAQLRPWLEQWQKEDDEALVEVERALEVWNLEETEFEKKGYGLHDKGAKEAELRQAIAEAQTKLGTGAILLARIEKWMASHEN